LKHLPVSNIEYFVKTFAIMPLGSANTQSQSDLLEMALGVPFTQISGDSLDYSL
jgi:hypothetical protein